MANIPNDKMNIGRTLLAGGPITQQLLQRELGRSGKNDSLLGKALLQSGFPREEDLVVQLLQRLRIPKINARKTKIPLETIRLVPEEVALRARVLPIDLIGSILVVVTPNLDNEEGVAEVRRKTGYLVTLIQCSPDGFDQIVSEQYRRLAESGVAPAPSPIVTADAAPVGAAASNGQVRAVPADDQDYFWKQYMSAGPFPADEQLM